MIRFERDGAIARLTLAAPERRNALTIAAMDEMQVALSEVESDTALRVLILTGEGATFCAGADFAELESGHRPDLPLTLLSDRIEGLRVPVIAGINGGVYGAGLDLALACDIRIGTDTLTAQVPAAAIGVHYPGPAIARAQARLGQATAARLFLAAERLDAAACRTCGIVSETVPEVALPERLETLAEGIAALAPLAVQGMKRSLVLADDASARVTACFDSADHRSALKARRAKSMAVFEGR
ncbi:enoyl-CoA hydratase/isomerase family protein [Roseobacter sp. HKCCA0434]|uniref:enoyl-CoA hydratase/isomerase family protein n=1 Tax=Roseobacter sp. HKCCA0434 TaxID=3079297 RepID=UPI002905E254|nr:enoyl-CoA hydratase/isomerase family protein [Roseobacter sp. HKCCA0434]